MAGGRVGCRRFLEDLYGDGFLSHLFDQSYIRGITNNTGELRAVIAHDAGSIDDNIIDPPFVCAVNQPKIHRCVDLSTLQLRFDFGKGILSKLPPGRLLVRRSVR